MYSLHICYFLSLALLTLATPLQRRQAPAGVPSYVVEYAPIVYLYTEDPYRPADIGSQLLHTAPQVNFTAVENYPSPLTLDNLNALNDVTGGDGGADVFLTDKHVTARPSWLHGVTPNKQGETTGAKSCAIIVVDNGDGIVDAFFMYFYAYNYGGFYVGQQVDDHVGDWEHNMVRFKNGAPQAVWYSQHSNGEAFTYGAVDKYKGLRPISFSANGSHANYAISGVHSHDIPNVNLPDGLGVTHDYTNKGPLWDPTLSAYYYSYDSSSQKFKAYDSSTPVNWLYFLGGWGNQQLPQSNPDQKCILGISALCEYSNGPTGPIDKDLNRTQVCPDDGILCIVRPTIGP